MAAGTKVFISLLGENRDPKRFKASARLCLKIGKDTGVWEMEEKQQTGRGNCYYLDWK